MDRLMHSENRAWPETELDLRLFDGAAAGATGGEGAGTGAGGDAGAAAPSAPQGRNKNPLANVQYGKQPEEAAEAQGGEPDTQTTADTAEAKRAAFEELIKGEYHDEFGKRTQQIINNRFKETKQMEEQIAQMQPMLDAMSARYGVDATDLKALQKAMAEDDSLYADEADRLGLSVEQLKEHRRLERENQQFREAAKARERAEKADETYNKWQQQADECKGIYPDFDLAAEFEGETGQRFADLLKKGVDVKTAYQVVHQDELLTGAIEYAVKSTQKRTVDNIRARGMRPSENGASGNAATRITSSDPSKWTKADRAEVARRVARGENIKL